MQLVVAKLLQELVAMTPRIRLHFSHKVEKLGVDALLLVAPYYNRPSQEGLYQHFKAIAEAVQASNHAL